MGIGISPDYVHEVLMVVTCLTSVICSTIVYRVIMSFLLLWSMLLIKCEATFVWSVVLMETFWQLLEAVISSIICKYLPHLSVWLLKNHGECEFWTNRRFLKIVWFLFTFKSNTKKLFCSESSWFVSQLGLSIQTEAHKNYNNSCFILCICQFS